jgi:DNA-binding MarR family transcriptional regulator
MPAKVATDSNANSATAVACESEEAGFVGLLSKASARVEHALNSVLVDMGLTYLQFRVLGAVVSGQAASPSACAKVLNITPSNVTRALDRLAALNLVSRTRTRTDRRAVSLQPMSGASALIADTGDRVTQTLARIFDTFSSDQLVRLAAELHRLATPSGSGGSR